MTRNRDLQLEDDTIAALSTPPGVSAIAVIRISGPDALKALRACASGMPGSLIPRTATLVYLSCQGRMVDQALATWFPAPNSYTGEDVVEISLHGNPLVAEALLAELFRNETRQALPGEFTFRAFQNGKLDLVQAEAVNELIHARTRFGVDMALASLEGGLSRRMKALRAAMIELGVALETQLEFAEDQFLGEIPALQAVDGARGEIQVILENAEFNDILRRGLRVVIAGRANVGKSSLFNALLRRERALVAPQPGTTRDFLSETFYVEGFPVELIDVAGWNRGARDDLEARGIRSGSDRIAQSDIVLFVLDASEPLQEADRDVERMVGTRPHQVVANKIDVANLNSLEQIRNAYGSDEYCEISAREDPQVDGVREFLSRSIQGLTEREMDFAISARQRDLLRELGAILDLLTRGIRSGSGSMELLAEELRHGLDFIGRLTGEVTTEEVLGEIFSSFCIGK